MKAYKIKVANEAESQEVQELLFELGYEWREKGNKLHHLSEKYLFAEVEGALLHGFSESFFNEDSNQQITLPQLRDLVVLHRNDVGDATHVGRAGGKFYRGFKGYVFEDGRWIESSLDATSKILLNQIENSHQMTWQDALRAVADGKEVEVDSISDGWLDVTTCCIELLQELESFRIKPQTIFLNGGDYTKEELLKIVGEML